jgi:hypothetical protein
MNMIEELKAWADKWEVGYSVSDIDGNVQIRFDSITWSDPIFSYNKETGRYVWYGGD